MSRRFRRSIVGGFAAIAGVAVGWSFAGARDVPLSPLHGDEKIGPTWPDRRGARGDPVSGEMDTLEAYSRPGFDPADVHPDVRALYEHTSDFEMVLTATWHRPFRLGARLASRWTSHIEQLNLPNPGGDEKYVSNDLYTLADPAAATDPRENPRLWVRTDEDTGEGVFVAVYASHVEDEERFVNIAVPLPDASLASVLRIDHRGDGLELTTDCPSGGLYLHTDVGGFTLPASQRFRVAPAGDPSAPSPPDGVTPGEADVLADQRITLFGLPLVTVRYAAMRA